VRFAVGQDVFQSDRMMSGDADGERGVDTGDVLGAAAFRSGYAADIIFAVGDFEARGCTRQRAYTLYFSR